MWESQNKRAKENDQEKLQKEREWFSDTLEEALKLVRKGRKKIGRQIRREVGEGKESPQHSRKTANAEEDSQQNLSSEMNKHFSARGV